MCGWHFAIVFILLILRSDHRPLMQFYFLLNVFTRAILSELCSRLWLVLICCWSFLVRSILNVEFFALFYIRCPWQNEYLQNEYLHPMQCDLFGMRFGLYQNATHLSCFCSFTHLATHTLIVSLTHLLIDSLIYASLLFDDTLIHSLRLNLCLYTDLCPYQSACVSLFNF